MRVHETDGANAQFAGDFDDGTYIMCPKCDTEQPCPEAKHDADGAEPYYCTRCGVELCYRPWYEW